MLFLRDKWQIMRTMNGRRFLNLLLLRLSYVAGKYFKISKVGGRPFSLSIEPTTACNLGCPECPSGLKQFTRATGRLTTELNEKLLKEVENHVFYINYYFQGEPFLNPAFLEFIKQATARNIYTSTSTNAHFIDKPKAEDIVRSGLKRLIISVDGTTQDTYEGYRVNGKLEKVLEASKHLVEARRELGSATPHLIFQFLAVKPNEHQVPEIYELAKNIGIDEVRIKTAQFYDYTHGNPLMPENERYARYKKTKDGTYKLKYKTGNHCWRMWSGSVITWDGQVVPCCFDKDARHVVGSLQDANFAAIWKGETYRGFRKAVLTARNQVDICTNCSEGTKVWA